MKTKLFKTILCIFILTISCFEGYNTIDAKRIIEENKDNILFYYNKYDDEVVNEDEYIGILTIPDIKLNRGFYPINSKYNDLSKNILYLKESIPIEEKNSMIILAAHRGNSKVSFFNNLDKLSLGSIIKINYKNKEYTYTLEYKYDELKDGRLNVYRDDSKDSLILITCNKYRKKYQTIYVSYRKDDANWLLYYL